MIASFKKLNPKTFYVFVSIVFLFHFHSKAQEVPNYPSFVKLKSGEIFLGKTIAFKKSDQKSIFLDSTAFPINEVIFYRGNKGGVQARIGKLSNRFYPSVHEADSVYFFMTVQASSSQMEQKGTLFMSDRLQPVKKVSAKNRQYMMSAYPKAENYIKKANAYREVATISFVASGALLAYTIIGATVGSGFSGNTEKITGIIGSTGLIVGFISNSVKKKYTRMALKEAYGLVIE